MGKLMSVVFTVLLAGAAYAQGTTSNAQPSQPSQAGPPCPCGMMGGGRMGHGPMCAQIMGQATVTSEKTQHGAVIRMTAKDPKDTAAVQQHAEMMARCMSAQGHPNP